MGMFRKAEVERLLRSHGQEVLYSHIASSGAYDPSTGSSGSDIDADTTVLGYFYNYSLEEIDGTSISRGDRKLLLSTIDIDGVAIPEPETDDEFVGVGDSVRVVHVSKIYSGPNVMCYVCQVRE